MPAAGAAGSGAGAGAGAGAQRQRWRDDSVRRHVQAKRWYQPQSLDVVAVQRLAAAAAAAVDGRSGRQRRHPIPRWPTTSACLSHGRL